MSLQIEKPSFRGYKVYIKRSRKKRKPRKSAASKLSTLLGLADAVFSRFIRERDQWKCVVCGSTERVQCGHLIRRGKHTVRFDETNCNAQCSRCNWKHNHFPEAYTIFFIQKYGFQAYIDLHVRAEQTPKGFKWRREDLIAIIHRYDPTVEVPDEPKEVTRTEKKKHRKRIKKAERSACALRSELDKEHSSG